MTTGLQLALLGGALTGLGLALLVYRFAPSEPNLADTLDRLAPTYRRTVNDGPGPATDPGGRRPWRAASG